MDDRYEKIYEALYDGNGNADFDWQPQALEARVRHVIDDVDERLVKSRNAGLRSDAKALLLLNFTNMVAVPLAIHGGETGYLDDGLQHDVELLADAATAQAHDEVSAHAVLDALTRNWPKLRLADVRLWGAKT